MDPSFRPEGEPWLEWHIRTIWYATEQLAIALDQPVVGIAACVASGSIA